VCFTAMYCTYTTYLPFRLSKPTTAKTKKTHTHEQIQERKASKWPLLHHLLLPPPLLLLLPLLPLLLLPFLTSNSCDVNAATS